jgi:hypothetical protein
MLENSLHAIFFTQEIGPPSTSEPDQPQSPLLNRTPSDSHVQFATRPETEKSQGPSDVRRSNGSSLNIIHEFLPRMSPDSPVRDEWIPIPLQTWFWVSIILFMVIGAIVLLVMLKVTNSRNGELLFSCDSANHLPYTLRMAHC